MRPRLAALAALPLVAIVGGSAVAVACVAGGSDGKSTDWDCPAQKFDSRFREAPTVYFSLDGRMGATATAAGGSVSVNWIAVGAGEKKQRAKREGRTKRDK